MKSSLLAKQDLTSQELNMLSSEYEKNKKSTGVSWLLFIFLWYTGAHRLYLGDTAMGVGMLALSSAYFMFLIVGLGGGLFIASPLFTLLGLVLLNLPLGVWAIVDLFLLSSMIKKANDIIEDKTIQDIMVLRKAKSNT